MPYRLHDDRFSTHPKIEPLSDRAFRLHVCALEHCAGNLTDGLISDASLRGLKARLKATTRHVGELIESGLWVPYPGFGHIIHDYLEHNPTKAEVLEKREKRASAGRLGGKRSGEVRREKGGMLDEIERKKRQRAVSRANTAYRAGRITAQPCVECGSCDDLEMHHFDYDKPEEVTWLCRRCHVDHHLRSKNEANA